MLVPAGGTDDPKFPVDFFENVRCITTEVRLAGDIIHAGEWCQVAGGCFAAVCNLRPLHCAALESAAMPGQVGLPVQSGEQAPCLHAGPGGLAMHVSLPAEMQACFGKMGACLTRRNKNLLHLLHGHGCTLLVHPLSASRTTKWAACCLASALVPCGSGCKDCELGVANFPSVKLGCNNSCCWHAHSAILNVTLSEAA